MAIQDLHTNILIFDQLGGTREVAGYFAPQGHYDREGKIHITSIGIFIVEEPEEEYDPTQALLDAVGNFMPDPDAMDFEDVDSHGYTREERIAATRGGWFVESRPMRPAPTQRDDLTPRWRFMRQSHTYRTTPCKGGRKI